MISAWAYTNEKERSEALNTANRERDHRNRMGQPSARKWCVQHYDTGHETGYAVVQEDRKEEAGSIDLTPSWRGLLPLLLTAYTDGTDVAKGAARTELERMARLADAYVEAQQGKKG